MHQAVKITVSFMSQSIWDSFPHSFSEAGRRILVNTSKVAIPALMLVGATWVQGAEAGPLAYASCMAACAAMPPICAAGGWAACLLALAAPSP